MANNIYVLDTVCSLERGHSLLTASFAFATLFSQRHPDHMLIMFSHISFWNHCIACFYLSFCWQSHFALPLFGSIQLTLCSMLSSKQHIASSFLTICLQQIWVDGDISWSFRIPGDIKEYKVTETRWWLQSAQDAVMSSCILATWSQQRSRAQVLPDQPAPPALPNLPAHSSSSSSFSSSSHLPPQWVQRPHSWVAACNPRRPRLHPLPFLPYFITFISIS